MQGPHRWCGNPSCEARRCNPANHSQHGEKQGTMPLHIGKTERDRARGHAQRKVAR